MAKYRKRPVVIDAIKWTDKTSIEKGLLKDCDCWVNQAGSLVIKTETADLYCPLGAWIIKGIENEFYPCSASIFEATYEKVK